MRANLNGWRTVVAGVSLATTVIAAAACGTADGKGTDSDANVPPAVKITTATVVQQPITRTLHVTGTLMAQDQAEVSAETAGRVVATPVERGTRVAQGDALISISATETEAQLREAEANAAMIEARLGLDGNRSFNIELVPEVANAKASLALAESEFARIQKLLDQRVVSQSEFDQRRTQVEAARLQYEGAKNTARQLAESLESARARVLLARKALADTSVRAPFDGLVAERKVSVGDYVTRGAEIATVVRINPLRVELTVPEQAVSKVRTGAPVTLTVDAYPGQTFQGQVRFVSPALRADQRALTVEAVVPNPDGVLKPGLFATAEVQEATSEPVLLVPAAAVQTTAGTSRIYVIKGDRAEERFISTGQPVGSMVEVITGVKADELVAVNNAAQLADGLHVKVEGQSAIPTSGSRE
jgi:RND family efflux transporter MFP subunit